MKVTLAGWALRQLAARLQEQGDASYTRSRAIRERQEKDPQTDEMINTSPDDMYELGYAEGRSSALKSAAGDLKDAAQIIENTDA